MLNVYKKFQNGDYTLMERINKAKDIISVQHVTQEEENHERTSKRYSC